MQIADHQRRHEDRNRLIRDDIGAAHQRAEGEIFERGAAQNLQNRRALGGFLRRQRAALAQPFVFAPQPGLRHFGANEDHQKDRQAAEEKRRAPGLIVAEIGQRVGRDQHRDGGAGGRHRLHHAGTEAAAFAAPNLIEEHHAGAPFAADPDAGDEAEGEQRNKIPGEGRQNRSGGEQSQNSRAARSCGRSDRRASRWRRRRSPSP